MSLIFFFNHSACVKYRYAGVLQRMIELMYVEPFDGKPGRWIDSSYTSRVFKLAQRMEGLLVAPSRVLPREHQEDERLGAIVCVC